MASRPGLPQRQTIESEQSMNGILSGMKSTYDETKAQTIGYATQTNAGTAFNQEQAVSVDREYLDKQAAREQLHYSNAPVQTSGPVDRFVKQREFHRAQADYHISKAAAADRAVALIVAHPEMGEFLDLLRDGTL